MSSFCAVIGDRSVRLTKSCWPLSSLSSAPLSIFLPSFFFPCPPHYVPVSYLLCTILCKDNSKRLFTIFGGGHVVASTFRRNLSIYWIGVPFLWCAISPFASINRLLQFSAVGQSTIPQSQLTHMEKSRRIRFELCSNPYPNPT